MLEALLLALIALTALPAVTSPAPPPENTGVAKAPEANLTGIIKADDYPAEAIGNGEEGTVGVRIVVDELGAVTLCEVEISSGFASLDAQTCTIVFARAKFSPAKDSSGRPVAGEFYQRITWKLEDAIEAPPSANSPELARLAAELPKASRSAELLNMGEIARSMDYPVEALRQDLEGLVHVRLLVDEQGRVGRCWVVNSSGHRLLDAQTCDLFIAKANYTPARDRRGRSVASLTDRRLNWRIESGSKISANLITRITNVVGPAGELRSCKAETFSEGSWHERPTGCDALDKGSADFRLTMREKSKLHDAVMVIETRALSEEDQMMPNVGRRAGEVLIVLRSAQIKVAPDGKLIGCVTLESIGLEGLNDVCAQASEGTGRLPPELLGKTGANVRYLSAIYLSGEPEATPQ